MAVHWAGITVSGDKITIVSAQVEKTGPITITSDDTYKLQSGPRAESYVVLHKQLSDALIAGKLDNIIIKSSAVSLAGTKLAHLEAAEVRGVVMCAAAAVTSVKVMTIANVSRNFGSRKADEYIRDANFWADSTTGILRNGSREAALLILAARESQ